ncbi:MAG: hypothetical protein KGY99_11045 [Phycisphaerae bacterium]|nr:hypothetical protein [Phycisphaerae bacterium]
MQALRAVAVGTVVGLTWLAGCAEKPQRSNQAADENATRSHENLAVNVDAVDPKARVYILNWQIPGDADRTVRVNGVPVSVGLQSGVRPLAPYLKPGTNTIRVKVAGPAGTASDDVTVKLLAGKDSRSIWQDPDIVWTAGDRSGEEKAALDESFKLEVRHMHRWPWIDADQVTQLAATDRKAILARIDAMHRALIDKDARRFCSLSMCPAIRAYVAAAFSRSPEAGMKEAVTWLQGIMASDNYKVSRADRAAIRIEPCGHLTVVTAPGDILEADRTTESSDGASTTRSGIRGGRMYFFRKADTWHCFKTD